MHSDSPSTICSPTCMSDICIHWGRGPLETGVYMLGTFQSLAESSSNVSARYISFTFHM